MQISAQDLCNLLNGSIEGNAEVLISGPSKIEEGTVGTISFYANPKYEPYVYTTEASALLVPKDFQPQKEIKATLIRVENVYESITFLLDKFGAQNTVENGISELAMVHSTVQFGENFTVGEFSTVGQNVQIGNDVVIFPQVYIGAKVKIGNNVILHPGVKIHHGCIIGNDCVIQSNTVIGGDGFGFFPQKDGSFKKISHTGNVIIEDDVHIGASVTIDRATMGSTIIYKGAKLDNLVHLAHNVEVGANTVIAAQSGVAGSTKIGENCMLGGQTGIVGHVQIADGSKFQAKSGVNSSIKETDQRYYGYPVLKYADYQRSYVHFRNLPDLAKKVFELEKKLSEMEKATKSII